MMKLVYALAVIGALAAGRLEQAKPALDSLSWMSGSWTGTTAGVDMEEHWTAAKGNSMIGIHRDVAKGRTVSFEFLRIEVQKDQIVYLSMPNGRSPATPFPLKEVSGTRVVFEHPTHDFPQRIIYWKDGNDLRARIEGTMNGKAGSEEWRWSPGGLKCPPGLVGVTAAPADGADADRGCRAIPSASRAARPSGSASTPCGASPAESPLRLRPRPLPGSWRESRFR
ncbi:MAG: hypothetical protein K2Y23_05200 [Cyanobacteria bacterium]|nr:hypothetical protein [Cyanobacteriota bacterium]